MPDITKTLADALRGLLTLCADRDPGQGDPEHDDPAVTAASQALALYDAAAVTQGAGTEEVERLAFEAWAKSEGIAPGDFMLGAYAGWLGRSLAARAAPASTPAGMVLVRADLVAFLHGTGELDGCCFGEKPPTERGNYWWRKYLPRPSSPSAEPQAGEEAR